MLKLDRDYDFRKDSKCGDPDNDSRQLYNAHKMLWNKLLPCGEELETDIIEDRYGRLLIKNNKYMNLSSDRMCPHFNGTYKGKYDGWLSDIDIEILEHKVRTIGGHIVFPAHQKNGFTINQARGVNRYICDRFDLTLECIRRFYKNEKSPLYETFLRYSEYFSMFVSFGEYVDFFMLQDFICNNENVKFSLPFDEFVRSPLPQTVDEYHKYKDHIIEIIECRNSRILKSL